jgi:coenzyme F420-0:L-glutamate ligase/coenzyme F420-1:gamma-L-glutamate ligase
MERGLLITETPHGFVCANGGVDASNGAPRRRASLSPSCRANRMPPRRASGWRCVSASASTYRSSSRTASGARGAGNRRRGDRGVRLAPLEDLRGTADHDGRVMRSIVRAVADELASAAELVPGKIAARPAAIVQGARAPGGEGGVGGLIMPSETDLFR